jgi:hypothetical protein
MSSYGLPSAAVLLERGIELGLAEVFHDRVRGSEGGIMVLEGPQGSGRPHLLSSWRSVLRSVGLFDLPGVTPVELDDGGSGKIAGHHVYDAPQPRRRVSASNEGCLQ